MKKNQTVFLKLCIADSLLLMMENDDYESISVNSICEKAGVGRTTFYRHFTNKNSKEDILIFKISYEWNLYSEKHEAQVKEDGGKALLNFIYENKHFFRLLYENKLITIIMRIFEEAFGDNWPSDKSVSYLKAFFVYGYFGVIYQWIKYNFDETPEQILVHIAETISQAVQNNAQSEQPSKI